MLRLSFILIPLQSPAEVLWERVPAIVARTEKRKQQSLRLLFFRSNGILVWANILVYTMEVK